MVTVRRRRRDPAFRKRVLEAYGSRCVVCELAVRRDDVPLALEAAHIKWHEARGPAAVENRLVLWALHHELFDTGAFTLLPELTVVVAGAVNGVGAVPALWRYHGEPLRAGPREGFSPAGARVSPLAQERGLQGSRSCFLDGPTGSPSLADELVREGEGYPSQAEYVGSRSHWRYGFGYLPIGHFRSRSDCREFRTGARSGCKRGLFHAACQMFGRTAGVAQWATPRPLLPFG